MKTASQKTIYYQYDQFQHEELQERDVEFIRAQLMEHPISSVLMQSDTDSSSSGSFKVSLRSNSSEETPKEYNPQESFETLLTKLNEEMQRLFTLNQMERFSSDDSVLKKLHVAGRQNIRMIDCVNIPQFGSPQLNLVPLKLLMHQQNS